VAGDGLGIMTAMVIARAMQLTFWQEFWFEYLVGFLFGWLIFQYKSMRMMSDSAAQALWMAFRAEFFSMLTVMGGMGAVMTYVTPMVVGAQPGPLTFAFWGFGMLGLLVGYVFTFPMNWMLVKVGWKHGMGSSADAHPVQAGQARAVLFASMGVLGVAAIALVAWLTVLREAAPLQVAHASVGKAPAYTLLERGAQDSIEAARRHLEAGRRRQGVEALDAAMRAAQVLQEVPPGAPALVGGIHRARQALQNGSPEEAVRILGGLHPFAAVAGRLRTLAPSDYVGVKVINAEGAVIGEVRGVEPRRVQLALGGAQDVLGFWDLPAEQVVWVPWESVVFGPRRTLGKSYAMVLTFDTPPLAMQ
jgi:hypothetical protein